VGIISVRLSVSFNSENIHGPVPKVPSMIRGIFVRLQYSADFIPRNFYASKNSDNEPVLFQM
jgi:hypothetical protein